ncbi:MAG: hypothetical protein IT208_06770 [Chthonomonadales bacterium]|nr:hypothetical protein [Chthonomonadales bacterium]
MKGGIRPVVAGAVVGAAVILIVVGAVRYSSSSGSAAMEPSAMLPVQFGTMGTKVRGAGSQAAQPSARQIPPQVPGGGGPAPGYSTSTQSGATATP